MNAKYLRVLWIALVFYAIALTCSIAGMEVGAVLLTLTILFGQMKWGGLVKKLGPDIFLWGFWLVVILGAIFLPDYSFDVRKKIAGAPRSILTLYALSGALILFRDRLETLLKIIFVACAIISLYGILQFFTGLDIVHSKPYRQVIEKGSSFFRVKAFYTNTMTYSYLFGMLFCLYFAYLIFKPRGSREWWWRVGLGILGLSLVMTFTRGLWIALALAIVVMAGAVSRKFFMRTATALLIFVAAIYLFSPQIRARVDKLVHLDNSNSQRIQIWKANWAMFQDKPLLGVGYEQNSSFVQEYNVRLFGKEGFVGHAHNHFIQILAGTGVFGFAFFLIFCGWFFWMAVRLWQWTPPDQWMLKVIALGSLGAQTVFHVGGLSEAVFVDRESNHLYVFICALTVAGWFQLKEISQSPNRPA